jgi:hypothetical protein
MLFRSPYPFKLQFSKEVTGEPYIRYHQFAFRGKYKLRYIIWVEEFPNLVYGISFFLTKLLQSKKRYEMLTNKQDAFRIFATCLEVIDQIRREHPGASFLFTAAHSAEEEKDKPNKRFRIYRRMMADAYSPVEFYHYELEYKNTYLMISRAHEDPQLVANAITEMLNTNYHF